MGANNRQVGGDHYKKHGETGEQHWDRQWRLFGPGYFIGCITKYVERYRDKNGIQDLEKAKHFLEKLIELETQMVYIRPIGSPAGTVAPETTIRPTGDGDRGTTRSVVLKDSGITPRQEAKPSYPGNPRKDNGQLLCGCWGVACEGHPETPIGESS